MAEFVMKDMAAKAGVSHQFHIASRGVSREEEGNPVYPPAQRELARHNIPVSRRAARQITRQDLEEYDYIYYMDSANRRRLESMFPSYKNFRPFLDHDVADPWYYGNFDRTFADINEGCKQILEGLLC
jgi:protein-tyrosine phosphatase